MVQSVDKALRIVKLFIDNDTLSFTEICSRLSLPKATAFSLLETLESHGFLVRSTDDSRYALGIQLLELGDLFESRLKLRDIAYPVMQKMCEQTVQTIQLTILNGLDVVYIEKVEPKTVIRVNTRIGSTFPAHCTATGKIMLANLPKHELDELLKGQILQRITAYTITDIEKLKDNLAEAKYNGYSIDNRESNDHVIAFGIAIYNHKGDVIAGISTTGLASVFFSSSEQALSCLRAGAEEISKGLGYKPKAN